MLNDVRKSAFKNALAFFGGIRYMKRRLDVIDVNIDYFFVLTT